MFPLQGQVKVTRMLRMNPRITTLKENQKKASAIGQKIKSLRIKKNLAQKDLAESIGVSNVLISEYERGRTRIPAEVIVKFADVLEISTDELLGCEDQSKPSLNLFRRFKRIDRFSIVQQELALKHIDLLIRGLEK